MRKPGDDVERLPLAGHADHRGEAPRLARGLDRLAHDLRRCPSPRTCSRRRSLRSPRGSSRRHPLPHRRVSVAPWCRALASRSSDRSIATIRSGSCEPAADHRAEAHEPAAEDDARRARLHVGGVERRADPGRKTAGERRAALERRLRRHLRERDLRHHRVLGEGGRAHEVAHRLAVAREPGRAVREEAEPLLVANRECSGSSARSGSGRTPHSGAKSVMTWSPGATSVTPGPTRSTTPAPSCPSTHGAYPVGSAPDAVYRSV